MNVFEHLQTYGSSLCWSRKGRSKTALENELNMRLHPRKHTRRRRPRRIHTLLEQGHKTPGEVGQNAYERGYDSWEEAIRVAQASSVRVVKGGRSASANPVFKHTADELQGDLL